MNRIISFIMLDFRSQPVLFRTLLPCFLLSMITVFLFNIPSFVALPVLIIQICLVIILISYTFVFAEKNRLETLHNTLPLTRGDIVKARYLFLACILAIIMLPPLLIKPLFFPNNENTYFYMNFVFGITSFSMAFMYPIYFKCCIAKAQSNALMSFFGWVFGVLLHMGYRRLFSGTSFTILSASSARRTAAAGLILLCLSYLLSLKIYRTKDLG